MEVENTNRPSVNVDCVNNLKPFRDRTHRLLSQLFVVETADTSSDVQATRIRINLQKPKLSDRAILKQLPCNDNGFFKAVDRGYHETLPWMVRNAAATITDCGYHSPWKDT